MRRPCACLVLSLGLSIPAFADGSGQSQSPPPGEDCAKSLVESQRDLPGVLRIGILYRDVRGRTRLLTGAYLFGEHLTLMGTVDPNSISALLWMGELRLETIGGRPRIYEANETSSWYLALSKTGWSSAGRRILVENDVDLIPGSLRAPGFRGRHFDKDELHLAPEFQGRNSNVRHEVRNSLQVCYLPVRKIQRWTREGSLTDAKVEEIKFDTQYSVDVAYQAVQYSVLKKIVGPEQIPVLYDLVHQLKSSVTDCARVATTRNEDLARDWAVLVESGMSSYWLESGD